MSHFFEHFLLSDPRPVKGFIFYKLGICIASHRKNVADYNPEVWVWGIGQTHFPVSILGLLHTGILENKVLIVEPQIQEDPNPRPNPKPMSVLSWS